MIENLSILFKKTKFSKNIRNFLSHNRSVFPTLKNSNKSFSVVLMEVNSFSSSHISYSYLSNILARRDNSKIVGYRAEIEVSFFKKFKHYVGKLLDIYPYCIYRSFGVREFIQVKASRNNNIRVSEVYNSILKNIQTKRDVENIEINGVLVGDLIYDSYLRKFSLPTIDMNDEVFLRHLYKSIALFFYWERYFKENNVCAVIVSHSVYVSAIPARLAIFNDIPAYEVSIASCYCLNREYMINTFSFLDFPERFIALPERVRKNGLKEAEKLIKARLLGKKDPDMVFEGVSAYSKELYKDKRLIKESDKVKVLIFSHCFFDSPHPYGNNIFPDFYEWLSFLGDMSNKTDYDWYIKAHPSRLPGNAKVISALLKRFPRITLIPDDASHHQILDEGVDVILTVYGTVGFEYAALGVPVVNCCAKNPHSRYEFNLNPHSEEEYAEIISNLEDITIDIKESEIYEYYFMKNLYYSSDIFLDDYDQTIKNIGGYSSQFTPKMYNVWQSKFSLDKHNQIINSLESFIDSKEYRMYVPKNIDIN